MLIPKMFKPRFSFGVSRVPGVPESISLLKNNKLDSIPIDTPQEEPGVPGVSSTALHPAIRHSGTLDTPDDSAGVAEQSMLKYLNPQETLNTGTPGTPDTPENPLRLNILPDTGPLPEGLTIIEARLYQVIATEPGLTRTQLCERAGLTLDEFNASTPVLCSRQLVWPDFAQSGGWITAQQATAASEQGSRL